MREIGISPRFSRDKFVPLQTKQRYSTRDISGEVFLTLFFRGFVPFLSLADFVSRDKNLQVADLQLLKLCFGELVTATTSNHQLVRTVFSNNKSITIVQIVHNKNAVWSFVRFYKFGKKSYLLPNLYLVTYSKIKGNSCVHVNRYTSLQNNK